MDFSQIRKKYDRGKEISNTKSRFNGLIQEAKDLIQMVESAKTELEKDSDFSVEDIAKIDSIISQMKAQIVI